jgi:DNA-binding XRE family transcriptional regulator
MAARTKRLVLLILDARKIEERRARMGLLRGELAKRADVHANTLYRMLNGQPVGLVSARKVSKALGVHVGSLIVNVTVPPHRECVNDLAGGCPVSESAAETPAAMAS